jgi:hypothetical protein
MGLPAQFAGGGTVRDNRYRAVFVENLDAYPGNSGSPVFNSTTHVVEGLQVRGKKNSFVKQGDCFVSRVCVVAGLLSGRPSLPGSFPGCNNGAALRNHAATLT